MYPPGQRGVVPGPVQGWFRRTLEQNQAGGCPQGRVCGCQNLISGKARVTEEKKKTANWSSRQSHHAIPEEGENAEGSHLSFPCPRVFLNYRFKSRGGTEQKDPALRCPSSRRRFPFRSCYTGWKGVPPLLPPSCLWPWCQGIDGHRALRGTNRPKSSRGVDQSRAGSSVLFANGWIVQHREWKRHIFHYVRFWFRAAWSKPTQNTDSLPLCKYSFWLLSFLSEFFFQGFQGDPRPRSIQMFQIHRKS